LSALATHLVVFVTVCGFLTGVWVLSVGSADELREVAADPSRALELGFWPVWVMLTWGSAIALQAGLTVLTRIRRGARAVTGLGRGQGRRRTRPEGSGSRGGAADRPRPGTRAWVTVMFTDIAGSTSLNERLGDEEWNRVLQQHRRHTRQCLLSRGGTEVGTQGDGFLVRFPSPAEAVLCAVDLQRATETDGSPAIRIGVHAGEAVHDDGDLIGRIVNVASRVTAEAEPGEILVTEPVAEYLGGKLDFEDRGLRVLKGISSPRHLLAVRWD
jgi:class 3 adenylate cyclase